MRPVSEKSGEAARYLSFALGGEKYAIPLLSVKEVIAVPQITPLPFSPPYFLGIMNLRGQIISVIDLRKKMEIQPAASGEPAVVICDLEDLSIGLIVDSVDSVLAPDAADVSDGTEIQGTERSASILGIYRRKNELILFLDLHRILDAEDRHAANQAAQTKQAA